VNRILAVTGLNEVGLVYASTDAALAERDPGSRRRRSSWDSKPEGPLPRGYARTEVSGSIQSLENVGIVVDDLAAAKAFFVELGLEQVGEAEVTGEWVDRVVGLEGVRCELSMLQTADGHGRLELMRFDSPAARKGDTNAPPNTLGIRRIAFSVDDIDAAVARLRDRGLELLGEVVRYEDIYRLCYVRGPEGIIVMLAERIG
jgi:catechol 2,3-dioxygenase-like lactoylglutathione lyase family enzyme